MIRAIALSAWLLLASVDVVKAQAYTIGLIGSNDCAAGSDEVNDEMECRDAAETVGGSYQYAGNWLFYPGGCYGNPFTSMVWLNTNSGTGNFIYSKVCRKDGYGDVSISMQSGGVERKAYLHIPQGFSGNIPLVVDSHAWGSFPSAEALMTGFSSLGEDEGFAVVYPRGYDIGQPIAVFQLPLPGGVGLSFNAGACCPTASTNERQDVLFIRELIAHVAALIPMTTRQFAEIDLAKVYATGMSNGGFLTNRLACEARDLFAAVAPVAGVLVKGISPTWGGDPFECPQPNTPLPLLHFHGTLDAAVPWIGNPFFGFPSIPNYISERLRLNGLAENDVGTVSYQQGVVTCTSHGPEAANVTLCKVSGGGHSWPGDGLFCGPLIPPPFQCSRDIDATRQIWDFFKRY